MQVNESDYVPVEKKLREARHMATVIPPVALVVMLFVAASFERGSAPAPNAQATAAAAAGQDKGAAPQAKLTVAPLAR